MDIILTTMIGAILGAFFSYIVYAIFTVHNIKKYLYSTIKSECIIVTDGIFNTGKIYMIKFKLDKAYTLANEINEELYKITGKKHIKIQLIINKISYLQGQIRIIYDRFIPEYIIKSNISIPHDFMKTNEYKCQEIDIENTFYSNNILNKMCLKSSNPEIQKEYENYLSERDCKYVLINILDNKYSKL
jgi:hypothetical protein